MRQLILATRNAGKVREFNSLLSEALGVSLVSLKDYGEHVPEVVEDADTFEGNALKKALEVSLFTGQSVIADDSGLVVDALNGAPGVISARYAGEQGDDAANNAKLIAELERLYGPEENEDFPLVRARYVAVLAVCLAPDAEGRNIAERLGILDAPVMDFPRLEQAASIGDRIVLIFRGTCEGEITRFPKGDGGFGYDPYFRIPKWNQTMAEIPLEQKNTISHRAQVVRAFLQFAG